MGFIRDIYNGILEKKKEEERVLLREKQEEYLSNLKAAKEGSLILDIESIKEEYSEIFRKNGFLADCLDNEKWIVLSVFDEETREQKIRNFSSWAKGRNKAADYPGYVNHIKINSEDSIQYFPENLLRDKDFVKKYTYLYNTLLSHASEEIRKDKDLIREIIKDTPSAIKDAHDDILKDEKFLLELLEDSPYLMKYIPKNVIDNEFVKKAFEVNPETFYYINDISLQRNSELILKLIDERPEDFERKNRIYTNYSLTKAFEDLLREDKNFCLEIIDRGFLEKYSSMSNEFKKDPEIIKAIVERFKEFDVSNDYDIERIAQYPSKLEDTLTSIDFEEERILEREKINIEF